MHNKFLVFALLAQMGTVAANAQQLVMKTKNGGIFPITSSVTADGKGRLLVASSEYDEEDNLVAGKMSIYNTDMQEEVSGILPIENYVTRNVAMKAKTDVKASDLVVQRDVFYKNLYTCDHLLKWYNIDANTDEGMLEFLKLTYGDPMPTGTIYTWEGSEDIASWQEFSGLKYKTFNSVPAGVIITIEYTCNSEGAILAMRDGWWNNLDGDIPEKYTLENGTHTITAVLNKYSAEAIQNRGLIITGEGYTINKVTIGEDENAEYPEYWVACEDINGRKGFARIQYNDGFFEPEMFGQRFPRQMYFVEDDCVMSAEYYYDVNMWRVNDLVNPKDLAWTPVPDGESREYTESNYLIGLRIYDIDNGDNNVDTKETYVTQTLFNQDTDWEYVVAAFDPAYPVEMVTSDYVSYEGVDEDGNIVVSAFMPDPNITPAKINCIKVMNNKGDCVSTLPMFSRGNGKDDVEDLKVYIINGKAYYVVEEYIDDTDYESLYSFDSATRSFSAVRRTQVAVRQQEVKHEIVEKKVKNGVIRMYKK